MQEIMLRGKCWALDMSGGITEDRERAVGGYARVKLSK
jgi:hypothetical protein